MWTFSSLLFLPFVWLFFYNHRLLVRGNFFVWGAYFTDRIYTAYLTDVKIVEYVHTGRA